MNNDQSDYNSPNFITDMEESYIYVLENELDGDEAKDILNKFANYSLKSSEDGKVKIYKLDKALRPYLELYLPTKIIENAKFVKEIFKTGIETSRSPNYSAITTSRKDNMAKVREQFIFDGVPVDGISDVSYHPNNMISIERNFKDGLIHDTVDHEPGEQYWKPNGAPQRSTRYRKGKPHNLFGPSDILHLEDEDELGTDDISVRFHIDGQEYFDEDEFFDACDKYIESDSDSEDEDEDEDENDNYENNEHSGYSDGFDIDELNNDAAYYGNFDYEISFDQ